MSQAFEQKINVQANPAIQREAKNPFGNGTQFSLALFAQTMMPDIRRIGNDGGESLVEAARYKIGDLNPAEIILGEAKFSAIGEGCLMKLESFKGSGIANVTGGGKECSRTNGRIK